MSQPSSTALRTGLLPPVIVLFEERESGPAPNSEWSAAASRNVAAAFVDAMAERQAPVLPVSREDAGAADASSLAGLHERLPAAGRPVPEALLISPYPPSALAAARERHGLGSLWVVSGVQVLSREGATKGKRLLLRAVLVGREGTVLYSDLVNEAAWDDLRNPDAARRAVQKLLAEYRTEQQKSDAAQAAALAAEKQAAEPKSPHKAELRIGAGIFFAAPDGVDLLVTYSPENSRWQFGYRYLRWTDESEDPFTGRLSTQTTETMSGPQVNYLFSPEDWSSWYLGFSVLRWSREELHVPTGASDSASVTAPFFGGGWTARLGKHVHFNIGMFLTAADLNTDTGVSSEESSGGFDVQLQIGIVF